MGGATPTQSPTPFSQGEAQSDVKILRYNLQLTIMTPIILMGQTEAQVLSIPMGQCGDRPFKRTPTLPKRDSKGRIS